MIKNNDFSAAMLLTTALLLSGGRLPAPTVGVRTPTPITDEDRAVFDTLDNYGRKEWTRRFKNGLTEEQSRVWQEKKEALNE